MATNKLNDIEVKQANTPQKDHKITDGSGLSLAKKYKKVREQAGQFELLFSSERRITDPMSDNMRRTMFRLDYGGSTEGKAKCVPHSLRTTACSILNEQSFNSDATERQMSHMERNGVRAAYIHHTQYKDDRFEMMQWWANHIAKIKSNLMKEQTRCL